jgi:hypothetical protein
MGRPYPQPLAPAKLAARTNREDRRKRVARAVVKRLAVSAVVAGAAPVATYVAVRPEVESAAAALAVTFAVPVAWAGFAALWQRRVDLDGALTIGAYGVALVATVISGGSALPLELRSAAETGAIGVACLVSVVLRRPLLLLALRILARRRERQKRVWRKALSQPASQGALPSTFSAVTVLVGVGFLVEAASQVALALLVPALVFVAASLPARFAVYGGEAGLYLALRRRGAG